MKEFRFILEKGSRKFICPNCGKKSFVRYIDTETGDYLPSQYGRCDRESKCSYHLNPYLDGYAKIIREQEQKVTTVTVPKQKYFPPPSKPEPVYFPSDVFSQTLQDYEQNVFIQNLINRVQFPFEVKDIEAVISHYYLGTVANGYRAGAVTFPFIDIKGNVRAIQVKQFNETNHTTGTDFLHSIIDKYYIRKDKPLPEWLQAYNKNDKKVSCLFGEHLLKYPHNPIALVEAPKTAIYGTLYFGTPEQPENLLWLAVYNKSSFSFDKLKVLEGRDVFVFPDLSRDGSTFKEWEQKAKDYEKQLPGTRFIFSDLLEQLAPETDRQAGNDFADVLIKQDWRQFRKQSTQEQPTTKPQSEPLPVESEVYEKCEPLKKTCFSHSKTFPKVDKFKLYEDGFRTFKMEPSENWDKEIAELEKYFASEDAPKEPVKLDQCTTITDISLFIESNLATVKANNGKRTFLPYLKQLQSFRTICSLKEKNNTK